MWGVVLDIFKWLFPLVIAVFLVPIYNFCKYFFLWDFSRLRIEFTLQEIWEKAGIIEIQGGAETGKSLLIILLTQFLKGRKWNNIPNVIPGCQELTLETLKKVKNGEYTNGLTGKNNVFLIDESWNFFSQQELNKNQLVLGPLLYFLSETSKTNFKVFFVSKQGARLPAAFNLLRENSSAIIRTLGTRKFCSWWGRQYYYLDIELIISGSIKKSRATKFISIPFSESDLFVFDNKWNLQDVYAKNRLSSIVGTFQADKLVRMLKLGKSRSERIHEEKEAEKWGKKKYPELFHREKFWEIAESRGIKTVKKQAEESGVSREEVNIEAIKKEVDKTHRRGSGAWNKALEYHINRARIDLAERRKNGETETKEEEENNLSETETMSEETEVTKNESEIDMTVIYEKASKNFRHGSPKWNRAVEKEIDLARQAKLKVW